MNTSKHSSRATTALDVANPAFLLERLAADCAPLQEYRELTRNSIDAIERRCKAEGRPTEGSILWDVDWTLARESSVYKLCCIDDGIGMSGPEMEKYINKLSSSSGQQSLHENFGLGARITAGHKNPAGLTYQSWQDGEGVMAHFWRDDGDGVYGLQCLQGPDGKWGSYVSTSDQIMKPPQIEAYGTKVVLCGKEDMTHTVVPPKVKSFRGGEAPGGMKWLTNYLNRRFFKFPDGIEIRFRELSSKDPEKWPDEPVTSVAKGAQLRKVRGAKAHLDDHSKEDCRGVVDIEGARVHWWLLNEKTKGGERALADSRESWESRGHAAALYQDELYEMRRLQEGSRRLKLFGITYGFERVVIYVEPLNGKTGNIVTSNTARSHLVLNGDGLPWSKWAAQFRQKMPAKLREMMDALLSASGTKDHLEAIKKRLKAIQEFLKVERYRRTAKGKIFASGEAPGAGGAGGSGVGDPAKSPSGRGSTGRRGNPYANLIDPIGDSAMPVSPKVKEPDVNWVSLANGLRAKDEMEDRAASYESETNVLKINRDFRVFVNLKKRFLEDYSSFSGAEEIVNDTVEEWCQQQLIEAILGVRTSLEGSQYWAEGTEAMSTALSEEALTVAVMPRYHVINAIRRALGTRVASLKSA